jgi:hypothetical protein
MIFSINQTFKRILASIAQGGTAIGPQRPLNLPWTEKAPLDLFNAHRGVVPTPLGTTGLDNRLTDGGKVVSLTHKPHFTRQKHYFYVSGTHFCSRLSKHKGLVRRKD